MPQLLWHVASVFNGHLRGPVRLIPNCKCLAVNLSLPVFTTYGLSRPGFEHLTFRLRGERSNQLCHNRSGLKWNLTCNLNCQTFDNDAFLKSLKLNMKEKQRRCRQLALYWNVSYYRTHYLHQLTKLYIIHPSIIP